MKYLLLITFSLSLLNTYSIDNNGQGEDEPGKTDEGGKKQGHWIVKGKHKPEKGYPMEDKIEEGDYKDSRKMGEWTFFYKGNVPRLKTTFINNKASGKYIKYHENGNVKEEGEYRMGRQIGTKKDYHVNGEIKRVQSYNSVGKPHGEVKEYNDQGVVVMEATIDNGKRKKAVWRNDDGSLKREVTYGEDGRPAEVKEGTVLEKKEVVGTGNAATKPVGTETKDGKPFKPDGFNMLYKNDELYQVGKFQGGRLWEGKFYKYDADGLLLKIEIYKGGKYHSDGQM